MPQAGKETKRRLSGVTATPVHWDRFCTTSSGDCPKRGKAQKKKKEKQDPGVLAAPVKARQEEHIPDFRGPTRSHG